MGLFLDLVGEIERVLESELILPGGGFECAAPFAELERAADTADGQWGTKAMPYIVWKFDNVWTDITRRAST